MKIFKIYPGSINSAAIDDATDILSHSGTVIFPTDTIYGIGCDALDRKAIDRLCRIKGINPDRQLLSVVCASMSQAAEYARIDNTTFNILKQYLPGPFTFILPASNSLPKVFRGRKTVGIRIPDNSIALALARELDHPILTTSVEAENEYELSSPESLGLLYHHSVDALVNGGEGGTEPSTIVDLTDSGVPEIIRQGKGIFEG
ncbi:MAG: threonylcarbamoyl-AMP synthase [Muribaculaceae bacterium]|nr:threonylcarbamoyl-AMP synthase [Muribaculaceae bacterium]